MAYLREGQRTFKFAGGIETKMDPKAVPAVRLLGLENGVFAKAISIQKRNGYVSRLMNVDGTVEPITNTRRLAARDEELLLFTDNNCYSKQDGNDQWTDAGPVVCAIGHDRAVVHTSSQQTMPDHATNGGVIAYAWEDSLGGVWWTTVDETSGTIYRASTQADALGQRPRCVAVGTAIHIYYAVPTTQSIMIIVINPSTPAAAVTPTILVSDLDATNPNYDACATTRTENPALIAWHEHATNNIRVGYVTAGGTLGAPANGNPSVYTVVNDILATSPLACAFKYTDDGTGDRIFLSYMDNTNVGRVRTLDGGTTALGIGTVAATIDTAYAAPTSVTRIALGVGTNVWVAFEEAAAQASQRFTVTNSVAIDGAAGTERTIRSVGLASRAFQAGVADDVFAVFVHDTTYFNVYLTLRLSDFLSVGRHLAGSAAGAPTRSHLSSAHVSDNVASIVLPYQTRLASSNSDKFAEKALRLITLDFDDEDAHQTAQIGNGLYMAGACPMHYDGRWNEQGFHVGPEYMPAPVSAAGGAMTISSTYLYVLWYEWTDSRGEIHRGPTSIGTTVVTGGADTQVTMQVPTLRVTAKANARICVARSLPGDTSRLWRVSSLDPTVSGPNGFIANDKTVDSISFVDRMSDATLQLQERIYTTGGVLSNDPTSLGSIVAVGKNRLFFTDSSTGSVVRYSQRIATGYGLEIAPELAHDVNPDGGDITALYVMDGIVVVFKRSSIYLFGGDGPTETGSTAVGSFSDARKVPGTVGCTNPASLVEVTAGLMFKSDQGIWILKRDLTVEYIGAPAERYNSQDVRRAIAMPGRTQVLFLTSSGMTLLYDHLFGQWATFTNHEGLDAAVVGGEFYYLRTNDVVWKETVGSYSDDGAPITLRIETAWLHMQEHLQGFARFWKMLLLGTWVSPHQLGIQYRLSYNDAWSDPVWLDATGETGSTGWLTGDNCNTIGEEPITGTAYGEGAYGDGPYGGDAPDIYQWRFGIHENGQSIQFRFEDFEKSGLAGASFELTEMTVVGGVKAVDIRPFTAARST